MCAAKDPLARALFSLEGLSVGDAFGERFFTHPGMAESLISQRALAGGRWCYTDDTEMALSIVAVLVSHGDIDQAVLADGFVQRFDPSRGYGPAMPPLLKAIYEGAHWKDVAGALFDGQGSFGNGAAMRAGPIGAYFRDDLNAVVEQAAKSSAVTHAHPEAAAGAIAVAVGAAQASRLQSEARRPSRAEFLDLVLPWIPEGEVRNGVWRAREMDDGTSVNVAVSLLGNGTAVSAQDTVRSRSGAPASSWTTTKRRSGSPSAVSEIATPRVRSWAAS